MQEFVHLVFYYVIPALIGGTLPIEVRKLKKELKEYPKNVEKATKEAYAILLKVAAQEDIPIEFSNGSIWSTGANAWSAGQYHYQVNRWTGNWIKANKIILDTTRSATSQLFILAHELGHHFSAKLFNDHSEAGADKYITTLFEIYTSESIQETLAIHIETFSTPATPKIPNPSVEDIKEAAELLEYDLTFDMN